MKIRLITLLIILTITLYSKAQINCLDSIQIDKVADIIGEFELCESENQFLKEENENLELSNKDKKQIINYLKLEMVACEKSLQLSDTINFEQVKMIEQKNKIIKKKTNQNHGLTLASALLMGALIIALIL